MECILHPAVKGCMMIILHTEGVMSEEGTTKQPRSGESRPGKTFLLWREPEAERWRIFGSVIGR